MLGITRSIEKNKNVNAVWEVSLGVPIPIHIEQLLSDDWRRKNSSMISNFDSIREISVVVATDLEFVATIATGGRVKFLSAV